MHMYHRKNRQKLAKICHYLLARLVVQKLIYYHAKLTRPIPSQGWVLRLSFKNSICRNTGKCELCWFSLRQSHIDCGMKFLLLPILNDTVNNDTLDVKKLYGQEK